MFSLVVDEFGVQYVGHEHAEHLEKFISSKYKMTTDLEGTQYCGVDLDWDYENRTMDLSMPSYVQKSVQRFYHPVPTCPQHSSHAYAMPQYGAKTQFTAPPDLSKPLDKACITRLQEIVGVLLYYRRAIDSTMLVALSTLASSQANGAKETAKSATHLLNYAAMHPDAILRYRSSDMLLKIHSDASYLSETQARSRAGGLFYLGDENEPEPPAPTDLNGAIHVGCTIMRNILSSATEAEVGALLYNGKEACPIHQCLEEMGFP
jgi:hypothetical protein